MLGLCHSIGCTELTSPENDFCEECSALSHVCVPPVISPNQGEAPHSPRELATMSQKYPNYYKSVGTLTEVDVYAVHYLFSIEDPSGAIQHASKKLLLSGVRTGGKSKYDDIREARDTLTRWMELHAPTQ